MVTVGKRRRRAPWEAEEEIVAAAEAFLRDKPFRELTVDGVMARTGLSRPSFYVHFRDRHQLVLRVVEHIGDALFAQADRWLRGSGGAPEDEIRAAIGGVAATYAEHGRVLGALSDASADDPVVRAMYSGLVSRFVDATAEHLEQEIAAGRVRPLHARETARALVWMNEAYLTASFGRDIAETPLGAVVETLTTIWLRVLYE